jgi:hypothetical protein
MAEQLTLAEKIHDPSVVDELDSTFTDHSHRVRWFRALLEDLRPRREALDTCPLCEPNHGRCVQIIERRMALQERGDVAHGAHVAILPADVRDVRRMPAVGSAPPHPQKNIARHAYRIASPGLKRTARRSGASMTSSASSTVPISAIAT